MTDQMDDKDFWKLVYLVVLNSSKDYEVAEKIADVALLGYQQRWAEQEEDGDV